MDAKADAAGLFSETGCSHRARKGGAVGRSVIIGTLLLGTAACNNPFSTREAEQPSGMQTSFLQPVTPEIVFENLKSAIIEKNIENYIRCFGLSDPERRRFTFVPEISVANNYQGVFAAWTIDSERNYVNHLFSLLPADSLSSLLLVDVFETQFGDSIQTTKEYDLIVSHTDPSVPQRVVGRMEMSLRKGPDALWFISYWRDLKTGDLPVWSLLKAEF